MHVVNVNEKNVKSPNLRKKTWTNVCVKCRDKNEKLLQSKSF